ncbi:LOW QUALITY PROTEIN: solute carrier family 2, facilitated glucose transporter member 11-like [Morphnus guianensis]
MNETWLECTGIPFESNMILLLWSFTVSVCPLGGHTGAVVAGPMAIILGRQESAGFYFKLCSFHYICLPCPGVSMNIQPMYLAESAPKKLRGAVALTSVSFTALGLVLQVVGLKNLLGGEESSFLLSRNVVPALIQLMALPWFSESPRYLLIDHGDKESCFSALQKLRGNSDLAEEMLAEQAAVKGLRAKDPWELFQNPALRWQLMSIVVLSSTMQLCGNDSMYFYAAYMFQEAGIPQDKIPYVIIIMGSCDLVMSVTYNVILDYAGQRPLLLGRCVFMAGWAIVFMVALSQQIQIRWMPYVSMACIFTLILSFGIGPAGVTGILPTEVFDQMSWPVAYMICGSLLWFNLFLVGTALPFIVKSLAHFCYVPFLVVCVCTALHIGFFLPEAKGKSFLETLEEFKKWNFKAQTHAVFYKGPEEIKPTM